MLRDAVAAIRIRTLVKSVDRVADAVREQCETARIVKRRDPVPQPLAVLERHVGLPRFHTGLDGLGGSAVLQVGGLNGEVDLPNRCFDGGAVRVALEGVEHQLVQERRESDVWVVGD